MSHTHGPKLASDPVPSVCPHPLPLIPTAADLSILPCFQRKQQELAQNSGDTSKGLRVKTRASMRILDGVLFMCNVVSSFQNDVSVATSQKNLIFAQVGPHGLPLDLSPMSMVDRWT
jgi:hypothetical protein